MGRTRVKIEFKGSQRQIATELGARGFCPVERGHLQWPQDLDGPLEDLRASFADLVQDRFMGDGGSYRKRRFRRFRLDPGRGALSPIEGTSIHQTLEDNPLNGGRTRTFESLRQEVMDNAFLKALIWFDFGQIPAARERSWTVGVHQVRIEAREGALGKPTPEGIHLDSEAFTVQHLMARHNVGGGEFRAYDGQKKPVFSWLQTEPLDSVFFLGTTYHSAGAVHVEDGCFGYRDIFLIDFDPLPRNRKEQAGDSGSRLPTDPCRLHR